MSGDKSFQLLQVGHCFHPQAVVLQGGAWAQMKFPAIVGLVKHPNMGWVMFDTGYAKRFNDVTNKFPNKLYQLLTPMHLCQKQTLISQLNELGISKEDIKAIFISHFHADHIAGLLDFPSAKFICSKQGFNDFTQRIGFRGLIKGYLHQLLPNDFLNRVDFIEDKKSVILAKNMSPFVQAYDLFSDQSFQAISLPGHAFGHFGLLFDDGEKTNFLVADACWTEEAYKHLRYPKKIASLIMSNGRAYRHSINQLSQLYRLNADINIYPSHCETSYQRWRNNA